MTASPGNSYTPNHAAREAWEAQIHEHRPYSIDELATMLTVGDIIGASKYQEESEAATLVAQPVPEWLIHTNQVGATALCNNIEMYSDDIEDLIYEDPTVLALLKQNETDQRAQAIRARRSTVAFLISHAAEESAAPGAS